MKRLISGAFVALLAACSEAPSEPQVTKVTETDGCTLYQYYRQGAYPVYWTKCVGAEQSTTSTTQRVGKTSRPVRVETN